MTDALTIPVAGRYFDQILSGEKVTEYRLVKPFWTQRLAGRSYSRLILTRGYPKGGGVEGRTRLTMPWQGCDLRRITHEHFGPKAVSVFAIHVDRRAAA